MNQPKLRILRAAALIALLSSLLGATPALAQTAPNADAALAEAGEEALDSEEPAPSSSAIGALQGWLDDALAPARQATGKRNVRRAFRVASYAARPGDTVRKVAYRYMTSPSLVAWVSGLSLEAGRDTPLKAGQKIRIPILFRSPSGFVEGEQLTEGVGIAANHRQDTRWGRPQVVQIVRSILRDMHRRWPARHPALVGSLSRMGGGSLGGHKSHRSGQDVDIGYFTKSANMKTWGKPSLANIDYERTWYLVDAMEKTGHVAAVFMSPDIQRRLYKYALGKGESPERLRTLFQYVPKGGKGEALIRHSPGHRDHLHIRLLVPEDMQTERAELGV